MKLIPSFPAQAFKVLLGTCSAGACGCALAASPVAFKFDLSDAAVRTESVEKQTPPLENAPNFTELDAVLAADAAFIEKADLLNPSTEIQVPARTPDSRVSEPQIPERQSARTTLITEDAVQWQMSPPETSQFGFPGQGLNEIAKESEIHGTGRFKYSLKIETAAIFDDNVSLSSSGKKSDLQLGIGPKAHIQLGSDESELHLGASYAGAAMRFLKDPSQRNYDQNAGVDGGWSGSRLRVSFRLGAQNTHSASKDAGERVGRTIYYQGVTSTYELTGKISVDASADLTRAEFNGLLGSREFRVQEFANYQAFPKLQFGVGSTQGWLKPDNAPEQTYDQALLRASAQPTAKLSLNASAGSEWRHYGSGKSDDSTPVFNAAISWQATERTSFSLSGRRRTYASAALQNQNFESTGLSLSATDAISPTINTLLTLGYEQAHYKATDAGVVSDRSDSYWFARTGVDWALKPWCSVGVFYEFSKNDSTGSQGRSFQRNRAGLSMNLSF